MSKGNEPAYPSDGPIWGEEGESAYVPTGLTKREYFAGLAMQGLCARNDGEMAHHRVAYAVEHADALLAELEKTNDQ